MHSLTLVAKLLVVIGCIVTLTLAAVRGRRAKAAQDRLIADLRASRSSHWFRVYLARDRHFRRPLKLFPYEARGVLVNDADEIRLLATLPGGERLDKHLPKRDLHAQWLGAPQMKGGNLYWLRLGQGDGAIMVSADTGVNAMQSREATADMCRMIAPDLALPESATKDFALEKNPASLTATILFLLLIGYALIDGIIVSRWHLLDAAVAPWGMLGLPVVALLSYGLLARAKVPQRETAVLTLLLSLAFAAAYIPALKRVDQWLSDGARTIAYTLGPNAVMTPVEPGPPVIDLSPKKQAWAGDPLGSRQDFRLLHGPLGLWQVDLQDIRERMKPDSAPGR